jgi:hypothetical protein
MIEFVALRSKIMHSKQKIKMLRNWKE